MYDRNHYLFTFGGTVLSGAEMWQTGLRFAPDMDRSPEQLAAALELISVEDCFNDFAAIISNQVNGMQYASHTRAEFAKVAVIKKDGKYGAAPKSFGGFVPGSLSTEAAIPPQLSLVATLGTRKSFGTAQRGRMYWPLPTQLVNTLSKTTGQIDSSLANAFRDRVITAIQNVEGEVDTLGVPVFAAVMSKSGGVSSPGADGTTNPILDVSVGRIIDTHRSRRSALQELYTTAPTARGQRIDEAHGVPFTPLDAGQEQPATDPGANS